jgi:hypothetical protein
MLKHVFPGAVVVVVRRTGACVVNPLRPFFSPGHARSSQPQAIEPRTVILAALPLLGKLPRVVHRLLHLRPLHAHG